jgi:hypothetical protein
MRGDAAVESKTSAARAKVNVCFILVVMRCEFVDEMCAGVDNTTDSVADPRFILLQTCPRNYNIPHVDSSSSIFGDDSILFHA